MSELHIYGIKTCDSCRKMLKWLDGQGKDYRWHDFRTDEVDIERLGRWIASIGSDRLVNRRSTTWRKLSEAEREAAADPDQVIALLLEHPTLIKRPVVEQDERILLGFNATVKDSL
jgi:Spx/MgsR family transcriptional regulator